MYVAYQPHYIKQNCKEHIIIQSERTYRRLFLANTTNELRNGKSNSSKWPTKKRRYILPFVDMPIAKLEEEEEEEEKAYDLILILIFVPCFNFS
jgi:hypothetical protein